MEAPTPASALIHSSTLVVIGVFLLLRFFLLLTYNIFMCNLLLFIGSLTVLYGSFCSIITMDLKKAVAYSTISQIGYLICGCGTLAYAETILFLVVHAFCKALLFICVGYIIHLFGGMTTIRRMGGIFYIIPAFGFFYCFLAIMLTGFPYTVGFYAKELIVTRVFLNTNFISILCMCC
jgi:NADH:ubiquinone oxidoreductase subunit 5 (subunit L)/multisubunit Na+/H+ antiporter MnhA subunit